MLCLESWVRMVVQVSIQISRRGVDLGFGGALLVMTGKMNVDASWRHWINSTSIGYIMKATILTSLWLKVNGLEIVLY